ncbi:MAG: response regulator [Mogibacterium sp.]|nr:response regulator [Mogibacterium sp.]MBQ6501697.1 response regulator [Mogibacterium sp.]
MDRINDEKDRQIEEQAAKIRLFTDLTSAGSWVINYAPDGSVASVQWGDGFRRLMGYSDQSDFPDEIESFERGIYPEDRGALIAVMTASVFDKNIISTTGYDFRFCRKDGSVRWFRSKGILSRDPEGRPVQFKGVTIDVTQAKEHDALYAELQNEAASLDTIHEMLGSGKWTMDFDEAGVMTRINWSDEFRRMLGYNGIDDFPDVLESWSDLLHPDDKERVLKAFDETISDYTGQKTYDVEYRLLTKNRGYRWYRAVGKPTRRSDGSPITYIGVFIDITKQKEMMQELAHQRESLSVALEEANQANKAKTAFLSNMSHEIRTPMNAIIGLDRIALNDPGISETTREHLEKIGLSAQHLLSIINDILDMSRIESGRMTVKKEEFSFAKALAQVNTIISGQCRDKGIDYECRVNGAVDDYYIGDEMKLRQVMINILGDAVKFTPPGGSITFVVETTARFNGKSTLRFIISDTGIGMSQDYLPKLFDAFSQEDSSSTNRFGSTGLGMAITKSIIELMNGTISVESEKNKGTTFTVTVTLTDCDHKDIGEEEYDLQPHELCVLVIDDDPIACEHAQLVLGQVGVNCEKALSGAEGLQMALVRHARREPYDLILVDWRMPDMDGMETTRQIRAAVGNETPVIILTSYNWDDIEDQAKEAGVDTFVAKPLFAGNVLDEFREAFKKKNAKLVRKTADLRFRRVLLAEDVSVNAEIMIMVLSMREIQVDHAENGRIAVEKFEQHEEGYYDAILMDLRMPEMDGLEATQRIRAMDRTDAKNIPIIALTANAFDEDVQRSMQAGLNAHLSKPVEPDILFETLEELLHHQ